MSKHALPDRPQLLLTLPIMHAMQRVDGYLYDDEVDLLIAATARVLANAGRHPAVVEIGSYYGKSTVILGMVAKTVRPGATVYAIDPHEGELSVSDSTVNVAPTFAAFLLNITEAGLRDTVVPLVKRSSDVRWTKPIDLLFVDGLHDYHSVAGDFIRFAPWVVPGGYVAFHDYGKPDFPGVTAFVDEVIDLGYYRPVQRAAGLIVLAKLDRRRTLFGVPVPRFLAERGMHPDRTGAGWRSLDPRREPPDGGERPGDWLRAILDDTMAPGATVLAAGLDRDHAAEAAGRPIWSFPRAAGGGGAALIAELEARRAEGAAYLLVAGGTASWLEARLVFRQHLDAVHRRVVSPTDAKGCVVYELYPFGAETAGKTPWRAGSRVVGGATTLVTLAAAKLGRLVPRHRTGAGGRRGGGHR